MLTNEQKMKLTAAALISFPFALAMLFPPRKLAKFVSNVDNDSLMQTLEMFDDRKDRNTNKLLYLTFEGEPEMSDADVERLQGVLKEGSRLYLGKDIRRDALIRPPRAVLFVDQQLTVLDDATLDEVLAVWPAGK